MGRLAGRVAIITGAGRGIRASIARLLALQGAQVVVNDLGAHRDGSGTDSAPAAGVVDQITQAGGTAITNVADISDHTAAHQLIGTTMNAFGRPDVLVNTAGILRDRMVFNLAEHDWDDVIRVHLKGTFTTTKFAAAHWRSQHDDTAHHRIINVTSVSGLHDAVRAAIGVRLEDVTGVQA